MNCGGDGTVRSPRRGWSDVGNHKEPTAEGGPALVVQPESATAPTCGAGG